MPSLVALSFTVVPSRFADLARNGSQRQPHICRTHIPVCHGVQLAIPLQQERGKTTNSPKLGRGEIFARLRNGFLSHETLQHGSRGRCVPQCGQRICCGAGENMRIASVQSVDIKRALEHETLRAMGLRVR